VHGVADAVLGGQAPLDLGHVAAGARIRAAKRLPSDVLSADELRGVLGKTLKDVISGELEPAVGNAAASIARAYIAVTEAGAVETLQAQVDELRSLIAARGSA